MSQSDAGPGVRHRERYADALADWLACAVAGSRIRSSELAQPSLAPDGICDAVQLAAGAGHYLDFDDTFVPGLAHISAATAPVAIVLGSRLGASLEAVLGAYSAGFETMAAMSERLHPHLYDAGWHPTAVCGVVGAAEVAAVLLGLDDSGRREARNIALLGAGGLLSAFGSDGKSAQVALAASTGVLAARAAARGAKVSTDVVSGARSFASVYAGREEDLFGRRESPAILENWIKAYPCCLQTHAPIDAALAAARDVDPEAGELAVVVHPISRQAAGYDGVVNGLEAKFSIPYTTAWALLHGAPTVESFNALDPRSQALASRIRVVTDAALAPNAATLLWSTEKETREFHIEDPLGSPNRRVQGTHLAAKLGGLVDWPVREDFEDARRDVAAWAELLIPVPVDDR